MELSTKIFLTFLVPFLLLAKPVFSQKFHYTSEFCLDNVGNYTEDSTYHKNLKFLLSSLTSKASLSLFKTEEVGDEGIDKTYGQFMCRGDLNLEQCHDCVNEASTTILEKCTVEKEAIIWYDECMVRYANRSIFNTYEEAPMVYIYSTTNVSDAETFGQILSEKVGELIEDAAGNKTTVEGFAFGEANVTLFQAVYVMAQCTPDILGNKCVRCLRVALRNMGGCCGTARMQMAMYTPSCMLRYDQAPIVGEFSDDDSSAAAPTSPVFKSDKPSSDSDIPSEIQPSSPAEKTNAAAITSCGISFMLGILMALSFLLIEYFYVL